jgi:dynein heavy chain
VSDSYDQRVLTTYLEEYCGDFLFDAHQAFHFYTARDGGAGSIGLPPSGHRDGYIRAIDALPLVQSPEVFGLHANADISYYTSAAKALWANLVDLQPRVGRAPGGASREAVVAGVARDVAAKMPPEPFDTALLAKGMGVPTPTQVVLLQELARWNGVCGAMAASLRELQRALSGACCVRASVCVLWLCGCLVPGRIHKRAHVCVACWRAGEIGVSAALEELSTSLFNGKLPPAWARLNPATEKPLGPWMAWFVRRHEQYKVGGRRAGCGEGP